MRELRCHVPGSLRLSHEYIQIACLKQKNEKKDIIRTKYVTTTTWKELTLDVILMYIAHMLRPISAILSAIRVILKSI